MASQFQDVFDRMRSAAPGATPETAPAPTDTPSIPIPEPKPFIPTPEQQRLGQLNLSMDTSASSDPAEAARRVALSKQLNLPTAILPPTKEAEAQAFKNRNPITDLIKTNPQLAQFMLNRDNAAMVGKNVDGLKAIENFVKDTGGNALVTGAKTAVGMVESLAGIANIFSGGGAGKALEDAGFKLKDTQQLLNSMYSTDTQKAMSDVQNAEGFMNTLGSYAYNPNVAAHHLVQSFGQMVAGGNIARALRKVAPGVAPIVAGAAGEGAVVSGSIAERVRQESKTGYITPGQTGAALGGGVASAFINILGGKLSQHLGIKDIDTLLASGKLSDALKASAVPDSLAKAILKGSISEGVVQEMPQSAFEQMAENIALGKPWDKGIPEAMASGLVVGSMMGAGTQMLPTPKKQGITKEEDAAIGSAILKTGEAFKAQTHNDVISKLSEEAAKDPLRQNAPESFHEFVDSLPSNDGQIKEVYVDHNVLTEALKQSGVTPEELATKLPEVAKDLHTAQQINGDVRISLADYLTHIAGSKVEPAIIQHLKTYPEGFTKAEADAYFQEQKSNLTEQAKKLAEEGTQVLSKAEYLAQQSKPLTQDEFKAQQEVKAPTTNQAATTSSQIEKNVQTPPIQTYEDYLKNFKPNTKPYEQYLKEHANKAGVFAVDAQQVHDTIVSGLNAAGRFTPAANEVYAVPLREFFTVNAAREGILPSELYARMPLNFALSGQGEALTQKDAERTLLAQHNLSERKLIHADRMGALATPSIAISEKSHPLTGFGEITLLADRDFVEGAKTFGADIYSTRYPQVSYDFSSKDTDKLNAVFADELKRTGESEFYPQNLDDNPHKVIEDTVAAKIKYLESIGKKPKIKLVKVKADIAPELKKFAKPGIDRQKLVNDPDFLATADKLVHAKISPSKYTNFDNLDTEDLKLTPDELRNVARRYAYQVEDYQESLKNKGKIDINETSTSLRDQIRALKKEPEFKAYVDDIIRQINPKEEIFDKQVNYGNGRKYIAHNLDNVIKKMKSAFVGGESFGYGLGRIRAPHTPQFKSIEHIRNSKHRLLDEQAFDAVKADIQKELDDLVEKVNRYGSYSGYDNVEQAIFDSAKMGLSKALSYNGFKNVPDDVKADIEDFIAKLKDMPTEYFEAKVLRGVGIGEFKAAVIPKDASQQVIDILKKNGITDIRTYKPGDKVDRVKQINQFKDLFFQKSLPPTITINGKERPTTNSEGKPIYPTLGGIKNFYEWFGDSKVVDDQGRPLVVYHGSKEHFEEFKTEGRGKTSGSGSFFTDSKDNASTYGDVREFYLKSGDKVADVSFHGEAWNNAPKEYEAYDSNGESIGIYETSKQAEKAAGKDGSYIDRAMILDEEGNLEPDYADEYQGEPATTDDLAAQARHYGFESFIAHNVVDVKSGAGTAKSSTVYVVFSPNQIKSAIGNNGAFSPTDNNILNQKAFHGSAHLFDKFSKDHIGHGEGAQAYGYGLYFTDSKKIAEYYRNQSPEVGNHAISYKWKGEVYQKATSPIGHALSLIDQMGVKDARKLANEWVNEEPTPDKSPEYYEKILETVKAVSNKKEVKAVYGTTYQVELAPEQDEYLLWDKPLSEQSDKVKATFSDITAPDSVAGRRLAKHIKDGTVTGSEIYNVAFGGYNDPMQASDKLHALGIRGVKYLDNASRDKGKGNYNYVIFSDKDVEITNKYYKEDTGDILASYHPSTFTIALLNNSNFSSIIHEGSHFYLEALADMASKPNAPQQIKDDFRRALDWFGIKGGVQAQSANIKNVTPQNVPQNTVTKQPSQHTEIILPDGTNLPAEWEVVDADKINASIKEGVNQPRDRTRASSNIQIQSIANNPDYRRLSDSPVMDIGSPVLSHDGLIVGGNGRFEAISKAYEQGTAEEYLTNLKADAASKGIDASVIDGMNKPVLVRKITQPFDTRQLAILSNSGTSLQYSGLELANIDAERMNGIENILINDKGDIVLAGDNLDKIKKMLSGYRNEELSSFIDEHGNISQDGIKRIRNALLASAYGNSETLSRMIESTDPDMRNVLGALTRSAAVVAKTRLHIKEGALPAELSFTNHLLEAVETFAQIRNKGQSLDEFLAQDNLFGDNIDPDTQEILKFLHDNVRSQKKLTIFIKDIYEQLLRVDLTTKDIFGDNVIPLKRDIINHAKQSATSQAEGEQQSIFGTSAQSGQHFKQSTQAEGNTFGSGSQGEQGLNLPFGATPEEVWAKMSFEQKVPYHEQWAQSFERYTLEGKSPTLEMQPVFARMREWMISVYHSMKEFLVKNPLAGKLNDEMRGVFDRIIASEGAIADAQRARSYFPLFSSAQQAEITQHQYDEYMAGDERATSESIDKLSAMSIHDLKWLSDFKNKTIKALQAEAKAQRKEVLQDVIHEVMSEPVNQARTFMRKGEITRADGEVVKATANFKLDKAAVKELFPNQDLSALKGMLSEDGVDPDFAANMFGFDAGASLINALLTEPTANKKIAELTDQRMLEKYGEASTPEALERQAEALIHNEARARFMAHGLQILTKTKQSVSDINKAAKEAAETTIAAKKIKDIRPNQYAVAEGKANKEAIKRVPKDPKGAVEAQRAALLNNRLAKAAQNALDDVAAGLRYVKRFDSATTQKVMGFGNMQQINAILDQFDFRKSVTHQDIRDRQSIVDWINEQKENGFDPTIDVDQMLGLQGKSYKDITIEDFRGVIDTIKQIEHVGRAVHKLMTERDKIEFKERMAQADASIRANANRTVPARETASDTVSKATKLGRQFNAWHRKLSSIIREMDGGKDNGEMYRLVLRPMNEAGDFETERKRLANIAFAGLMEKLPKQNHVPGNLYTKKTLIPGTTISLSQEQRVMFGMNWGNAGNKQRVLDGGLANKKRITMAEAEAILDTLTKPEWDFIQGTLDYFATFKDEVAALERKITGVEPKWIEATPIHTKYGTYRGGYFPAKYDTELSTRSESLEASTGIRQQMKGAFGAATTRNSGTKERAVMVKDRPVLLSYNVITNRLSETIHRLAWEPWLMDMNRILKALDEPIRNHYGNEILSDMRKATEDIAEGDQPARNALDTVFNHLRQGSSIVGMGWSVQTALLQPSGLFQSWERIGGKWIASGVWQYLTSPFDSATFADEQSSFMRNRAITQNREMNDVLNTMREGKNISAFKASFFWMIAKMQRMVDIPTWLGAREKALAQLNYQDAANETQRKDIEKQAAALADQAVLDSQGGGQIKDLAGVQRGTPAQKLYTNFFSYFNVLYNRNVELFRRTHFSNPMELASFVGNFMLLNTLPVLFTVALRQGLKGGCDDGDMECLAKKFGEEQTNYLFGQMVLLREMGPAVNKAMGVGDPFGYHGPAGLRFLNDLFRASEQAAQGEFDFAAWKAYSELGAGVLHLPIAQVNRTMEGIMAIEDGKVEGANVIGALISGKPKESK